jgi:sugar lactone lactonase YvrE
MKTLTKTILIAFIALLIFSCKTDKKQETEKDQNTTKTEVVKTKKELPNTIALKETSLYPEGVVYNETTKKTYVGSYFKGKIVTVDLNGKMSDFVIDESLVAVVGLAVDTKNNRLLVCNSDAGISQRSDKSTTGQLAQVIAYDLTSGEKLKTIDLSKLFPGGHFLNDLVQDASGNTYVTDSFSPVIYKIDANDNASVLVNDKQFEVPQGTFGLNGIVYHPDNYLIVGRAFGGKLYKVALDESKNVQEITLNKSVNSLDGLLLTDANTLVLVSNYFAGPKFEETVYKIETTNNWTSASVTNSFTDLEGTYPTTLTEINNELYVNFGYFTELINPESAPNDSFKLQKVEFSN